MFIKLRMVVIHLNDEAFTLTEALNYAIIALNGIPLLIFITNALN